MTGSLPDMNLSVDFNALVDRVRREANQASRSGQYDSLNHLAEELVRWQIRLRQAFVAAIGEANPPAMSWGEIVGKVFEVRHQRDGAEALNKWREDASHDTPTA